MYVLLHPRSPTHDPLSAPPPVSSFLSLLLSRSIGDAGLLSRCIGAAGIFLRLLGDDDLDELYGYIDLVFEFDDGRSRLRAVRGGQEQACDEGRERAGRHSKTL